MRNTRTDREEFHDMEGFRRAGFSLVELAVVIVILGLLAGMVVAAKSLVRSAELREVLVELEQYKSAVSAFRERYRALPGDMANATEFWGEHPDCAVETGGIQAPGVCNGNGDGRIGERAWTSSYPACGELSTTGVSVMETYQFWRHLELAGLIGGTFLGRPGGETSVYWEAGVNTPDSKAGNGMTWTPMDAATCDERLWAEAGQGQALRFGGADGTYVANSTEELTPEEVLGIDRKVDDGLPGKGGVRVIVRDIHPSDPVYCSTAALRTAMDTAEYNLRPAAGVTPKCAIYFPNALK